MVKDDASTYPEEYQIDLDDNHNEYVIPDDSVDKNSATLTSVFTAGDVH